MKKEIKNQTLAFAGLEFFFWAGYCCAFGFLSSYLKQAGYADSAIGLVSGLVAIVIIFTQPLFGYIADTHLSPKKLVSAAILISIGAAFLIPLSHRGFLFALLSVCIITITENSVTGVISSWSSKLIASGEPINYGLSRGMGSVGYAVTAFFVGNMMLRFGSNVIFIMHAVFMTIDVLIILFALKNVDCMNTKKQRPDSIENPSVNFTDTLRILLRNKKYVTLMITIFLIASSLAIVVTYYPIILLSYGGTNADVGLALFVTAFSEGCIMVFYSKFSKRFKTRNILLFSLSFFVIRYLLFILAGSNIVALIVLQATQSFSYGLYLPAIVAYTSEISPLKLRSTALSVGMAVNFGISSALGNLLGSFLSKNFGLKVLFPTAIALAISSVIIFSISYFIKEDVQETSVSK